jgi:Tub family
VLPRELQIGIWNPELGENLGSSDISFEFKAKNARKLLFLKNKPPRWNETTQSHCLNFGGRVTQPSIKNMQLIAENDFGDGA